MHRSRSTLYRVQPTHDIHARARACIHHGIPPDSVWMTQHQGEPPQNCWLGQLQQSRAARCTHCDGRAVHCAQARRSCAVQLPPKSDGCPAPIVYLHAPLGPCQPWHGAVLAEFRKQTVPLGSTAWMAALAACTSCWACPPLQSSDTWHVWLRCISAWQPHVACWSRCEANW